MKIIVVFLLILSSSVFAQKGCKFEYEIKSSGDSTASSCMLAFKGYSCEINYPTEAENSNIEGSVILSANFTQNCTLTNIEVTKSLGYGLDELAINILKEFENQLKKDNKTCCFHDTKMMFPIKFKMH
ncbi:MAG: energy transducer TonB [Bacteroidota bacterium]|nr:energy transducer TonB [Bacteroidota bacterium]